MEEKNKTLGTERCEKIYILYLHYTYMSPLLDFVTTSLSIDQEVPRLIPGSATRFSSIENYSWVCTDQLIKCISVLYAYAILASTDLEGDPSILLTTGQVWLSKLYAPIGDPK